MEKAKEKQMSSSFLPSSSSLSSSSLSSSYHNKTISNMLLLFLYIIISVSLSSFSVTTYVDAFYIPSTSIKSSSSSSSSSLSSLQMTMKKSPIKYLRIKPKPSRNNKQRVFELQTAITTLVRKNNNNNGIEEVIDLHSQLHFGEEEYFQFYNDENEFGKEYDQVFYELIVSDTLLHTKPDGTKVLSPMQETNPSTYTTTTINSIQNPVSPPPSDEATASSYGLSCQLNVIDYTKDNWIHCDVTREEYLSFLSNNNNKNNSSNGNSIDPMKPIWALSSTAMTPIQEFTSALIRPFTPSSFQSSLSRFSSMRLFTNLFLPGANLASIFRVLLWILSPSPEVSILLLDWSSIVNPRPTGMISPIFAPSMQSLLSGNILNARKLIFAQAVVSGQTAGGKDLNIVKRRNDVALNTITNVLEMNSLMSKDETKRKKYALLYGAMHCQDLQSRFEKLGFTVQQVKWRKAWGVNVPTFGMGENLASLGSSNKNDVQRRNNSIMSDFVSTNSASDIAIGIVIVPIYLLIGGMDWLVTVNDIAQNVDQSLWLDAGATALFYIIRHLASYLALAKFVVEWDGESNLFGE